VAGWEERAPTREDKSLRDPFRVDVAGREGVAEPPGWAEVSVSTSEVRKVTEAPRSLTMAISWARRGVMASRLSGKVAAEAL